MKGRFEMEKIYIDMDNTISNAGDFTTLFTDKDFFINQEPLQENITWLLAEFPKNDKYILSAVPARIRKNAIQQKNQWLDRHFPIAKNDRLYVITYNGHANKVKIADVIGNILIDDSMQNLLQWKNAGGIAISAITRKEV